MGTGLAVARDFRNNGAGIARDADWLDYLNALDRDRYFAWILDLFSGSIDSLGYGGWIGCEYRPRAGTSAGLGWRP